MWCINSLWVWGVFPKCKPKFLAVRLTWSESINEPWLGFTRVGVLLCTLLNYAEAAGILVCGCVTTVEWTPLRKRAWGSRRRLTQNLGRDEPLLLSASIHHFLHGSLFFKNVLVFQEQNYSDGKGFQSLYLSENTNTLWKYSTTSRSPAFKILK